MRGTILKPGFFIFLLLSCASCNRNKNGISGDNVLLTDSVKYLAIADAAALYPDWKRENTFVYQVIALPDQLHPTNGTTAMRSEVNLYTQMFLVETDYRTLLLRPGLVKSLPVISDDQLHYTFELRDEPKWDDGEPLTTDDVIFTVKANKCPLTENPHTKPYWDNLQDIVPDTQNKRKFTVVMKHLYFQNVNFWGDFPVMQRKYYDPKNLITGISIMQMDDSSFHADKNNAVMQWAKEFNDPKYGVEVNYFTGIGPYKVAAWEPDQFITLERKKNHWTSASSDYMETSLPEKIIFRLNRDPNSQTVEFKSQTYDGSSTLSAKVLFDLQQDSSFNRNFNSRFAQSFNYSYIAMNMRPDGKKHKKIFSELPVRKAMAMLTPVDHINTIINKGKYRRQVGPVSPLKTDFNPGMKAIPLDVEGAKKLLDEAGWKDSDNDGIRDKMIDGEKIQLSFNINFYAVVTDWKDMALMISEEMQKAGVKANLNGLEVPVFLEAARSHDFDMLIGVWSPGALPDDFSQIWHRNSWTAEGSNYAGFGDAVSDALIDSINITLDDSKRMEMSKRFQQMVYDQQPYIFLFESARRLAVHKRFGNCEMYFERPGLLLNNYNLLAKDESAL